MPEIEQIGSWHVDVHYVNGRYLVSHSRAVGSRERITRPLALRNGHEQTDLYNELTEDLAAWIEEVAVTVTADRQTRYDKLMRTE